MPMQRYGRSVNPYRSSKAFLQKSLLSLYVILEDLPTNRRDISWDYVPARDVFADRSSPHQFPSCQSSATSEWLPFSLKDEFIIEEAR